MGVRSISGAAATTFIYRKKVVNGLTFGKAAKLYTTARV
jgi:hypothetical protein